MCKNECEKENNCSCDEIGKIKCIPYEQKIIVNKLARAYVPFQKYCSLLSPCEAFLAGTIFPELNEPKPYLKKGGC